MNDYRDYLIETYRNVGEPSAMGIRARPISGQGLPVTMNVACSTSMRKAYPIGSKFIVQAKLNSREGSGDFLYVHPQRPYKMVTEGEAEVFKALHFK